MAHGLALAVLGQVKDTRGFLRKTIRAIMAAGGFAHQSEGPKSGL
jgi:hypothetical protein